MDLENCLFYGLIVLWACYMFRYYASREISDYTHEFYTRLGTNIILFAIMQ